MPITHQTLIVMLAPAILGQTRVLAIATFLALALAGLPSLEAGGLPPSPDRRRILISWIFMAWSSGIDRPHAPAYRFWPGLLINLVGGSACYLIGGPWMAVVAGLDAGRADRSPPFPATSSRSSH